MKGTTRCGPGSVLHLTVGIFDRKEGTIAALFSPRLWTEQVSLLWLGIGLFGTVLHYII